MWITGVDNLLFAAKNLTFDFGCGSGYDEIGKRIVYNLFERMVRHENHD